MLFALGLFLLLCGVVAFFNAAFGVSLFFLAAGSIIAGKAMTDRKYAEKVATPAAKQAEAAAKRAREVHISYPVAGVTFDNDDGTSRQRILKDNCEYGEIGLVECVLKEYKYEGEPAIAVWTQKGRVGNIRRSDVREVSDLLHAGDFIKFLSISTFENDEGDTIYRADVTAVFDPENPKDRWYFALRK